MAKPPERSAGEVNRAHWDALAAVHGTGNDDYYDVDALAAGTRGLGTAEDRAIALAIGDVAGKDVLHLQCHLGFDAVLLARRGARVIGADFSESSLSPDPPIGLVGWRDRWLAALERGDGAAVRVGGGWAGW